MAVKSRYRRAEKKAFSGRGVLCSEGDKTESRVTKTSESHKRRKEEEVFFIRSKQSKPGRDQCLGLTAPSNKRNPGETIQTLPF